MKTNNAKKTNPYSRSGNFHRIHEELLKRTDAAGVFQTTKTIKEIEKDLKIGKPSVSSSTFQWSDPTGKRGYRRVRKYTSRTSASCAPEALDATPTNIKNSKLPVVSKVTVTPMTSTNDVSDVVTKLVTQKLEHPAVASLIETFVKARVEEALRKQLGL